MTAPDTTARHAGLWPRALAFLAFGAWFWLVYWLCDFVAAGFTHHFDLTLPIDGWLPFVPQLASAYLLINPVLAAPLFILPDLGGVRAFYATLALEVAIAGLVFLLFPVASLPPVETSGWPFLRLADTVNLTYNMFPSLHVALAVSCGMALSPHLSRPWKLLLWLTVVAIIASTVLTKQHYVADVLGGFVLAVLAMRFIYPGLRR